jgi:hypothetical protein
MMPLLELLRPRRVAVTLLSAALAFVWAAGAHQHLCFDGLEPPATLHHAVDLHDHLDHHSPERGHTDVDVARDTSLTRTPRSDTDAPATVARVEDASAALASTIFARLPSAPLRARTAPRFSQPPLRAPPA